MLETLGSTARTAAPLGIRTAAYLFDTFFSILLPINILLGTFVDLARPSSVFDAKPVFLAFFAMSYFAITEGVWGASFGKALCGLRVVTEGGAPPRFGQALVRALICSCHHGWRPAWSSSSPVSCTQCRGAAASPPPSLRSPSRGCYLWRPAVRMDLPAFTNGRPGRARC
jgi:hypothetical protein